MKPAASPDVDAVRRQLSYDPESGELKWVACRHKSRIGLVAGTAHNSGYIRVNLLGRHYLAHRLAWLFMHEEWPEEIDHINGCRTDNRISNLRIASRSQNMANKRHGSNTSGFKGVSLSRQTVKGKTYEYWIARITTDGRTLRLGYFSSAELAHEAYSRAAKKIQGEFAYFNRSNDPRAARALSRE